MMNDKDVIRIEDFDNENSEISRMMREMEEGLTNAMRALERASNLFPCVKEYCAEKKEVTAEELQEAFFDTIQDMVDEAIHELF